MTKKIKELTQEDIEKFFCKKYDNHGGCRNCPLYRSGRYVCCVKEYLEIEVEVEE